MFMCDGADVSNYAMLSQKWRRVAAYGAVTGSPASPR